MIFNYYFQQTICIFYGGKQQEMMVLLYKRII